MRSPGKLNILLADDDETVRNLLEYHSRKCGFEATAVEDGVEFMDRMNGDYDVVLLDLNMPRAGGIECLEFLAEKFPEKPAVILSGADEVENAVAAMKAGAMDYLTKPFDLDEVFHVLRQTVSYARLQAENRALKSSISVPSHPTEGIIGRSQITRHLLGRVQRIAGRDSTVLIQGESGVGKGVIARTIHYSSPRRKEPFITVSCPALPRELLESELFGHEKGAFTGAHQRRIGKIEMATGGSLFLDEIGDLPLELQPKLLNVIQDREFHRVGGSEIVAADIRIIAATNVDLEEKVRRREFREDLYYRLNVIPITVPPLRERPEDIAPLTEEILSRISRATETSPDLKIARDAMNALEQYRWPGNVRQLENVLERAAAFCEGGVIELEDLSSEVVPRKDSESIDDAGVNLANLPLRNLEQIALTQTLRACGGNKAEAARRLGITEKSIYNKLKRYQEI